MSKRRGTRANAFEQEPGDLQDVTDSIYGGSGGADELKTSVIRAKPIALSEIVPDRAQPRRAIPMTVRGEWDNSLEGAQRALMAWWERVSVHHPEQNLIKLLESFGEGYDIDEDAHPMLAEFVDLVALAGDIRRKGLTNPITVVRKGGGFMIETGERRYLAHVLLDMHGEKGFDKIPAVVNKAFDVWRQASENAARRPLNAIGVARQLALLLMDMYPDEDFFAFDDYILPGECDQPFYAQVANGQVYRVRSGFGQRIMDATGLKSKSQIRQYRALLRIPEEVWMVADAENWTENYIREFIRETNEAADAQKSVTGVTLLGEEDGEHTLTGVNVSSDNPPAPPPEMPPVEAEYTGDMPKSEEAPPSPGDFAPPARMPGKPDDSDKTFSDKRDEPPPRISAADLLRNTAMIQRYARTVSWLQYVAVHCQRNSGDDEMVRMAHKLANMTTHSIAADVYERGADAVGQDLQAIYDAFEAYVKKEREGVTQFFNNLADEVLGAEK